MSSNRNLMILNRLIQTLFHRSAMTLICFIQLFVTLWLLKCYTNTTKQPNTNQPFQNNIWKKNNKSCPSVSGYNQRRLYEFLRHFNVLNYWFAHRIRFSEFKTCFNLILFNKNEVSALSLRIMLSFSSRKWWEHAIDCLLKFDAL
jgi:hypothetical protein